MLKNIWPTKSQFSKWSKPSKLTFIGVLIGLISLFLGVISYFFLIKDLVVSVETQNQESFKSSAEANDYFDGKTDCHFASYDAVNVLVLSFNDFKDHHKNENNIERVLQQRISELKHNNIIATDTETNIQVKCYFTNLTSNEPSYIKRLGERCGADIVIYGELYDTFDSEVRQTRINFMILPDWTKGIAIEGKTEMKQFLTWFELREGTLLKDIDYIIYWLIAHEQVNLENIESAVKVTDFISDKFPNEYFSDFKKSLSFDIVFGAILVWLDKQDADNAKNLLLKAIEYSPKEYFPYLMMGILINNAYDDQGLAIKYLLKGLEIDPNTSIIHRELAKIYYFDDSKKVQAKKHAMKAIELDPKSADSHTVLGMVLNTHFCEYDMAEEHLKQAVTLDPNSILANYHYAAILLREKDQLDLAKSHLDRALELDPNFSAAHHMLSFLYSNKSDLDQTKNHLLQAIEIDPNDAEAHFWLGGMYFNQLADYQSGKRHMLKAIEIEPNSAKYHFHLAVELERHLNNSKLAQEYYLKAKQIDPNYRGMWDQSRLG